jgi:RNA polymerase sigma-70 factor (ECF subfamily)
MDTELLVPRAVAGEREALGQLYQRFAPRVYGYFYYQLAGSRELAECLTERVFGEVLGRLSHYPRSEESFLSWLLRAAHACLGEHLRSRIVGSIDGSSDPPSHRSELDLCSLPTQSILIQAITRLDEDQRHVIVLRFLQGISLPDTADVLGKTEDAIKTLQACALQSLKGILNTAHEAIAVA